MAQVRYLVNELDEAILFYLHNLGFTLDRRYGDAMAIISNGDLQLWLAAPTASASQPLPDGQKPEPGGWNRIVMSVAGLDPFIRRLKSNQVHLLQDITPGVGGRRALCQDPSGNLIELFEAD